MALPKLNSVKYTLTVPSSDETIEYRPFLVKEQKILMIAQESESQTTIQKAIADTITECTFGKVDPWSIPSFDLEYIFINVRGKSIGEELELSLTCPDDGETVVPVKIPLDHIEVSDDKDHNPVIKLTDDVTLYMTYPTMTDISSVQAGLGDTEQLFSMIKTCIAEIHDGEEIHHKIDITDNDLNEFIDTMSTAHLEKINHFFETMPKLTHTIKVTNPKTKKENEITLSGFDDFFV